jgi:hypothetical protein
MSQCYHPRKVRAIGVPSGILCPPETNLADLVTQKRARGEEPLAGDRPPAPFGQCIAWDFDGPVVLRVAPKFAGYRPPQLGPAGTPPVGNDA